GPAVQVEDVLGGLVGGGPHVGVVLGAVLHPGRALRRRAAEGVAEVAELDARQVLDQAEQVGAGRGAGPAQLALREPVDLPQYPLAQAAQMVVEQLLRVVHRSSSSGATVWEERRCVGRRAPSDSPR